MTFFLYFLFIMKREVGERFCIVLPAPRFTSRLRCGVLQLVKERMYVIVSDAEDYVIIRKLLDFIFSILPIFVRPLEIQTYLYRTFLA
jgi:hypothetical protein